MITIEERKEILRRLSAPFPPEAIERTTATITKRGYDTTGIKAQYIVDRLNEILGLHGWRTEACFEITESKTAKDRPMFDVVCDLTLLVGGIDDKGEFLHWAIREATGGHSSISKADAKKGAYSNALKKAAALLGCGAEAYRGTIDDDNVPSSDDAHESSNRSSSEQREEFVPQSTGSADRGSNGRVTSAQLGKMKELVTEVGGDWERYRQHVKQNHNVMPEYANKTLASALIESLVATARRRRFNGHAESP